MYTVVYGLCWSPTVATAWDMTLSIDGGADGGATTVLGGGGSLGTVDFGSSSTAFGTQAAGAGERVRITTGTPGSHFIATLVVTATFTGVDVPVGQTGNLEFYQSTTMGAGLDARARYAGGIAEDWSVNPGGSQIPVVQGVLDPVPLPDSDPRTHQVAMAILDTDTGSFTLGVTYVLIAN